MVAIPRNYVACCPFHAAECRYFRLPSEVPLPGVEERMRRVYPGAELGADESDELGFPTSPKRVLFSRMLAPACGSGSLGGVFMPPKP